MTIPGIDIVVALALAASIGDIAALRGPETLIELSRAEPDRVCVNPVLGQPDSRPGHQAVRWACPRNAGRARSSGGMCR